MRDSGTATPAQSSQALGALRLAPLCGDSAAAVARALDTPLARVAALTRSTPLLADASPTSPACSPDTLTGPPPARGVSLLGMFHSPKATTPCAGAIWR
jgi:hypothetical protein